MGTTIKIPTGGSQIKSAKFVDVMAAELRKWFGLVILVEIKKNKGGRLLVNESVVGNANISQNDVS